MAGVRRVEVTNYEDVAHARAMARAAMADHSDESVAAAELVASELVTNGLLHGGGWSSIDLTSIDAGVRIEVTDRNRRMPLVAVASSDAMTGRGLHLVARLAARWGIEPSEDGKVIWAEIVDPMPTRHTETSERLVEAWADPLEKGVTPARVRVDLGRVPTHLLVAAKRHVDNLVREFTLAASGGEAGTTAPVPVPLAELIDRVIHGFQDARMEMKRQATEAARAGAPSATLVLNLPMDAAEAAEAYLQALDEVDGYCRANRLLTLETPPQHRVFRHWYIGEISKQVRAASAGRTPPPVVPFEHRLLEEMDEADRARRVAERAAGLYTVAVALAAAVTAEDVASAVLEQGVSALGAAGGGVLLATEANDLFVPGTVGYDEPIVAKLRSEQRDADLPAAYAVRTGEAVWLETIEERDARFPALAGFEPETIAMCAVPLALPGRVLGALRFSFTARQLFDRDERRYILALAAEAAEALERAHLLDSEREARRRVEHERELLQRSLLPVDLPAIEGIELGAAYSGAGGAVGGDFYDVFALGPGRWGFAIGDVRGRGPEAAAVTALTRYTIRTAARLGLGPGQALAALNDAMLAEEKAEQFCTAVVAMIEIDETGVRVTEANGGHPPVALVRDGEIELLAPTAGLLGVIPDADFAQRRHRLEPGDALVFYTDGVSEARHEGEQFGDTRLVEVLHELRSAPAHRIADDLIAAARSFGPEAADDDAAVLVVRVQDGAP